MLINLHGFVIKCDTPSMEITQALTRPFQLFLEESGTPELTVTVVESAAPYEQFPRMEASFSTPRNIVYDGSDVRLVDYFGTGAALEDKVSGNFTLYGTDLNFLQEAFYLLILSAFGQYCDRNGLLRVHAMAVSYGDRAILMPVPPGGGKSTMAYAILQEEGFKLISDDEPVVSTRGEILPFALRMGTLDEAKAKSIPPKFVYTIDRMEFGKKYFIDALYWEDRLETRALTEIVYLSAKRVLNGSASITAVPKYRALKSLLRDAIIGVGLYQGLEFMLSHSPWSTIAQVGTVFRRTLVAWKLLRRCQTYEFILSGNVEENRKVLRDFAHTLDGD